MQGSRAFFWLVLASLTIAAAGPARADLIYTADVSQDGIRYILVSGEIAAADDLSKFDAAVTANAAVAVAFNSRGGNVYKAMELGRQIRSLGLATIQIRGPDCSSACALAFLGGVLRYADPGSIGVHKSSFAATTALSRDDAVSAVQEMTADVVEYIGEMGADPQLLALALHYESDDIRLLSGSEMAEFGVTTPLPANQATASPEALIAPSYSTPASTSQPEPRSPLIETEPKFAIPQPQSGRVLHKGGSAPVKLSADGRSETIATLANGTTLRIVGNHDRWYRVRAGKISGFMHHTWVYVDQYDSGRFGARHIQIRSFDNYRDTEAFVRSSGIAVTAYLVTNGWFAVALRKTFDEPDRAKQMMNDLKKNHRIPDDSYSTFGTTYVRKVCCE